MSLEDDLRRALFAHADARHTGDVVREAEEEARILAITYQMDHPPQTLVTDRPVVQEMGVS